MIPKEQLEKRARKLYEDVAEAKVYIGDEIVDGAILKKVVEGNILKVYVSLSSRKGTIGKIEVYDKDGELMQVQSMSIEKKSNFKFMAVVEIRVTNETIIRD